MIVIRNGATAVSIARQGAEIMTWEVGGRPLLWEPRPEVWPETAPLCFRLSAGLATAKSAWKGRPILWPCMVLPASGNSASSRSKPTAYASHSPATPATRRLYPFDFTFTVDYAVEEGRVSTVLTVANTGERPMPYACGPPPRLSLAFRRGRRDGLPASFRSAGKSSGSEDRAGRA